jgi:hypothetical protein
MLDHHVLVGHDRTQIICRTQKRKVEQCIALKLFHLRKLNYITYQLICSIYIDNITKLKRKLWEKLLKLMWQNDRPYNVRAEQSVHGHIGALRRKWPMANCYIKHWWRTIKASVLGPDNCSYYAQLHPLNVKYHTWPLWIEQRIQSKWRRHVHCCQFH